MKIPTKNLYQKGSYLSIYRVRTLTDRSYLRYKKDTVTVAFQRIDDGVKSDDGIRAHPFRRDKPKN
jgi:hypothetical protein